MDLFLYFSYSDVSVLIQLVRVNHFSQYYNKMLSASGEKYVLSATKP